MNNMIRKISKVIPVFVGVCLCVPALAGESVDRTLDVRDKSYVDITHLSGTVNVTVWDEPKVRVVGELHDKARELIFERSGKKVQVKVKMPRSGRYHNDSDRGDKLEIFVPADVKVKYDSVNGEFFGSQFTGGADIETVNGDIRLEALSGRLDVESVNGDIRTENLSGRVQLETVNGSIRDIASQADKVKYSSVNGDIEGDSNADEVSAETVNGDVELKLAKVSELHMTTVNGSLESALTLKESGVVKASSVGGTIKLLFQPQVSARFDIEAHAGGRIKNNITDDKVNKPKYGPGRWLDFSSNNGSGRVKVSTVHGSVILGTRQ